MHEAAHTSRADGAPVSVSSCGAAVSLRIGTGQHCVLPNRRDHWLRFCRRECILRSIRLHPELYLCGRFGHIAGQPMGFWSARFARVYPIYLLSLVLIYQAYLTTEEHGLWSIVISTVSSLTLTQAWIPSAALSINSAGWSLSVEAFLYLCFPSLLFLVGTGTKRLITLLGLCCGVSLAPALLFVIAQHGGDALTSLVRYNPLFHLGSFVTGMAMERLTRYRQLPAWAGWLSLAAIGTVFATGRAIPYEILNNGLLALPFAVLIGRLASSMSPLDASGACAVAINADSART